MKIDLETISLAEILIECGKKNLSGCLSVDLVKQKNAIDIWFWEGYIISVTGNHSIRSKIVIYEWISPRLIPTIKEQISNKPIGEKFVNVYGISQEQIEQLFEEQLAEIYQIFNTEVGNASFKKLKDNFYLPWKEMTGREIHAFTLVKNAITNDCGARYTNYLPESTLTIKSINNSSKLPVQLDSLEKQVLSKANTNKTIDKIAKELKETRLTIQKVVYFLESIGLVEKTLTSNKLLELTANIIAPDHPLEDINLNYQNWKQPLIMITSCNLLIIMGLFLGLFQDLEWSMLDRFFRWRGTEKNQKVTLITISDTDINRIQSYPIPDNKLAQTIKNIKQYNPNVIGIDLYRDIPQNPGYQELLDVYRTTPNLIGVEKIVNNKVLPPPILKEKGQVGFSDLIIDKDGVLRRALISLKDDEQQSRLSLGTYVGLFFLNSKDIEMSQTKPGEYSIGDLIINTLNSNTGGYWQEDLGGTQILLNYQSQLEDFTQISFWDAYNNQIDPKLIKDRIVLIGTIADSKKDFVNSPYTRHIKSRKLTPGVVIHANVAAQLIDAVLEKRPLLKVANKGQEILWVFIWSVVGILMAIIVLEFNLSAKNQERPIFFLSLSVVSGLLSTVAISYLAFLSGWWIPCITPFIATVISFNITGLRYQKELRNLLYIDKATKVFKRHYFQKILEQEFVESQKNNQQLALIFVKFQFSSQDNYNLQKIINSYLAEVVKQIKQSIIKSKIIARYNPHTLAILLPKTDSQEIKIIIKKITKLIKGESKKTLQTHQKDLADINYQIGFSLISEEIDSSMELIAAATKWSKNSSESKLKI